MKHSIRRRLKKKDSVETEKENISLNASLQLPGPVGQELSNDNMTLAGCDQETRQSGVVGDVHKLLLDPDKELHDVKMTFAGCGQETRPSVVVDDIYKLLLDPDKELHDVKMTLAGCGQETRLSVVVDGRESRLARLACLAVLACLACLADFGLPPRVP